MMRERKDAMRRLALAARARLSDAERAAHGLAIAEAVLGLPELAEADPVLAFVGVRTEVPTLPLLERLLAMGRGVLLPSVSDEGRMRALPLSDLRDLAPGTYGIPEPRARFASEPRAAAVVIAPGVAFDARGGRLGYGGGFYDRYLRDASGVPRIGLCFEVQLVEQVPMTDEDERVDVVVTEQRVLRAHATG